MIKINQRQGGKNIDIAVKDQTGTAFNISGFTSVQMAILTPAGREIKRTAVVGADSGVIDGVTYPAGTWARYVTVNNELAETGIHQAQLLWLESGMQVGTTGYLPTFEIVRSGWGAC